MTITNEQLTNALAVGLNKRINIIGIDEPAEEEYIRAALPYVVPYIPEVIRPILFDSADGLSDQEVEKHSSKVMEFAVSALTVGLPTFMKSWIAPLISSQLQPWVDLIFEYAQTGAGIGLPEGE